MKKTILALALATSFGALAGSNSVELTDEQFSEIDYTVHVTNSLNHICGGMLIANEYVITASHCIQDDIPDDWKLVDTSGEVKIDNSLAGMKAVVGNRDKTKGKHILAEWVQSHPAHEIESKWENGGIAQKQDIFSLALYENVSQYSPYWTEFDEVADYKGDIAVFKLSEPYIQQSTLPLQNEELYLDMGNHGANVIINGWGFTAHTGGFLPDTIRQTAMTYNVESKWSSWEDQILGYEGIDKEQFLPTPDGGKTNSGDSGSPMIVNGKVQAFVSEGTSERTGGTGTVWHLEWLATHINAVNTIGQALITFETEATTESKSWHIPVQPLKLDGAFFTTELNDDTGLWTLDSSNCDGQVDLGDICYVDITFNPNNNTVNSDSSGTLALDESTIIELNVVSNYIPPANEPTNPTPPQDDDSGSSGGSLGFSLLGGLIFLTRKLKR